MGLLDGGAASIFASVLSSFYLPATLHRRATVDDGTGSMSATWSDEPVRAQLDVVTESMRNADNYTDTDQRILILAQDVERPSSDDEVTVRGQRWSIAAVASDPCEAAWDLRGRAV